MNEAKRKKLEAKGWRVGSAQEFLGLSDPDAAFIEFKLKLAQSFRATRLKRRMGQLQVAKIIHSSQSRVAKMEAADPSVSVDLLVRSHLALGTSGPELGRIIASPFAKAR
ncbi:MAG: transcriptional regulator [Elusimicrobia bacterium RIFCSPLOWO2_12_FULL_59_9]|nr:MAG: transcriptional regulator [Elusimicrobia bacterium RIFCSPLOWO2_12_FULL_59_9]